MTWFGRGYKTTETNVNLVYIINTGPNTKRINNDLMFVQLNNYQTVWCVPFHRVAQNSPDHLWPAEIEGKGINEESELLLSRNMMTFCALSLSWMNQKLYLPNAIKDLMFCAGISPIYWFNQYWMWVKEISHQDCIHHRLIIWTIHLPQLSPRGGIEHRNSVYSTFFSCRPAYKEKNPYE